MAPRKKAQDKEAVQESNQEETLIATSTEQAPEIMPEITAVDIVTMVNIIDAGSQRGSWRGEELVTVGTLRNKLASVVAFLQKNNQVKAEK